MASRGKIVRGRQTAAARTKTPYDRQAPPAGNAPYDQNPNWLAGVVYSTSRMIATGTTKLFTFLFAPESSSSSSSSGTDSSPEDVMDDGTDDYDVPCDNGGSLNEKNGTTSELIECFRPEPQLTLGKSDIKRLIEKLLMQETFSREECDGLTKIIKSRVIDGSTMEEEKDEKLGGIPHRTVGDVTPELCSKAFMEAKQRLEEAKQWLGEKVASSSVTLSQVTTGEPVSPVEIAKAYMRAHPSWSSSINCVESGTPSPIGREFFKDKTPYSVAGNSYSSSKDLDGIQPVEGDGHAGSNSRQPTIADLAIEHEVPKHIRGREESSPSPY